MPFGNLDLIKLQLGIDPSDTAEDNLLTALMGQASTAIETFCDKPFGIAEYTEFYSGNGSTCLIVDKRPIVSIANLWLDDNAFWGQAPGGFSSATLLQQGVDYAVQVDQPDGTCLSGLIWAINGWWDVPINYTPGLIYPFVGPGNGNIKIQYTAGYATIPQDLQLALYLQLASIRNSKNYGQLLASESLNDSGGANSYSIAAKPKIGIFTAEVLSLISKYRDIAVA